MRDNYGYTPKKAPKNPVPAGGGSGTAPKPPNEEAWIEELVGTIEAGLGALHYHDVTWIKAIIRERLPLLSRKK